MSISDGVTIGSTYGHVGYGVGSTGVVTVTGANSKWENISGLHVGYYGNGTLNITNGGYVSSTAYNSSSTIHGCIGYESGSTGEVTVTGANSKWENSRELYVGYKGDGTLNITNGGSVSNGYGHIGYKSWAIGVVTVDGDGSEWVNGASLYVGYEGKGTLNITNGGYVSNSNSYIGYYSGSTGVVTVDGGGSKWENSSSLRVGSSGKGTLNIANGGLVSIGENVSINSKSLLNINVSNNDMLVIGEDFTNGGEVSLSAGVGLAAGVYTPISVGGDWMGSGRYDAFGGIWDETLHTFTVAGSQSGISGEAVTIDLSDAPRLDIVDGAGQRVGASFGGGSGAGEISFTGTAMTSPTGLSDLELQLTIGDTVLSGWAFDTDLSSGDEVFLSFYVGAGCDSASLGIWHYNDSGVWTEYDARDMVYSDGWVSFTVDGFSGYAITGTPEPATMSLLALGGLAMIRRRRRRR